MGKLKGVIFSIKLINLHILDGENLHPEDVFGISAVAQAVISDVVVKLSVNVV